MAVRLTGRVTSVVSTKDEQMALRMSERLRLETLTSRDGLEEAKQWAKKTAVIYVSFLSEPSHYASQADWRPVFQKSMQELIHFAETGETP